jgi:hypothetical protein
MSSCALKSRPKREAAFCRKVRGRLASHQGDQGADVISTIFCDFCQFSAFFLKTNVMIKFLETTRCSFIRNYNIFAEKFGEKIFKILTSAPDWANVCLGPIFENLVVQILGYFITVKVVFEF